MAAIVIVLVLLGLFIWAFARKSGRWPMLRSQAAGTGSLTVLERRNLTPHHVLFLVRVGERTVLLATHPQGIAFEPPAAGFSSVFQSALGTTSEAKQ
jgi:flagellar biogenesis protein FliO